MIDRGNGLIYDSDLDITWLQDANLASTNTFGVSGIDSDGGMFGYTADEYIAAMNVDEYLGFNQWRLTTMNCSPIAGYNNCADSEFGHLFYNELSGINLESINTSADPDLSLFINIVEDWYWTSSFSSSFTRVFNFKDGSYSRQFSSTGKDTVWAVHDGDIGAVPIPAAVWLFGSGLIGLISLAKRKSMVLSR